MSLSFIFGTRTAVTMYLQYTETLARGKSSHDFGKITLTAKKCGCT